MPTLYAPSIGVKTTPAGASAPAYQVKVVDIYGTVQHTFTDANVISIRWSENEPEQATFTFPKSSTTVAQCDVLDEVQIYRDGDLKFWGPILSISGQASSNEMRAECAGVGWYLSRLVIDAERTNLLGDSEASFETGLTGWTKVDDTSPWVATVDTTRKVRGSQSLKVSNFTPHAENYVTRTFTNEPNGVGVYLTVVGYVYVESFTDFAFERRGLYLESEKPGEGIKNVDYYPIDHGTPRGQWVRTKEFGVHVPPNESWIHRLRCYAWSGEGNYDALQVVAMESLSTAGAGDVDFERDIATIAGMVVQFVQQTQWGKVDLNIGTNTPAVGVTATRHYQFVDHTGADRAIAEWSDRDDGIDWWFDLTPTTRTFTTTSSKGTDRSGSITLTFGGSNVADYRLTRDGGGVATDVFVLGDGSGPDREEGHATDTSNVPDSKVLQRVFRAPQGTNIGSLDTMADEYVGPGAVPEFLPNVRIHDRTLIDTLETGDVVAVSISDGWTVISGNYRISELELDAILDHLVATLVST